MAGHIHVSVIVWQETSFSLLSWWHGRESVMLRLGRLHLLSWEVLWWWVLSRERRLIGALLGRCELLLLEEESARQGLVGVMNINRSATWQVCCGFAKIKGLVPGSSCEPVLPVTWSGGAIQACSVFLCPVSWLHPGRMQHYSREENYCGQAKSIIVCFRQLL